MASNQVHAQCLSFPSQTISSTQRVSGLVLAHLDPWLLQPFEKYLFKHRQRNNVGKIEGSAGKVFGTGLLTEGA